MYTKAGNTAASRFTLDAATSTVIAMGSNGELKIDFSTVTHAQDNSSDYFFGTSGVRFIIVVVQWFIISTAAKVSSKVVSNLRIDF